MLVESDTGSGKTEVALRWFLRLYADHKVNGLYFALPTRVAARELYGRVLKTIRTAFPSSAERPSPVLLAVPGYVRADGEPATLPNPENLLWEDDDRLAVSEKIWAAERPKRFLAAPIGVGTIDQALLSVLKVKHSLLRSVCLDRHLLVVDEVHASDTYMTEILAALLKGHVSRGGYAMLLSATLGEAARAKYFDLCPSPLDKACLRPYPAICLLDREIAVPPHGRHKAVKHDWLRTLDHSAVVPYLQEALSAGCRVLVVCNTVGRAQGLLRTVESAGFPPEWLFRFQNQTAFPHHGRFARPDREVLDRVVSERFGKNSPEGPVLLIGTQTLEQSLDIDADFLVTDLAPIDVLLQRIGRLHRHNRLRPEGYETARLLIRVPENALHTYLTEEGKLNGPAGLGQVYEDGRILQKTLDVLSAINRLEIPRQNRLLVESATHEEALAGLPKELWQKHADWLWGPRLIELRQAETALITDEPFGELHYADDGRWIQTRLGEGDIVVRFETPVTSPFGQPVEEILLPGRWLRDVPVDDRPVPTTPLPEGTGFVFEVRGRKFQYTRLGLERCHDESAV